VVLPELLNPVNQITAGLKKQPGCVFLLSIGYS